MFDTLVCGRFDMPNSIFTYENLYRAYLDCRKNKRNTANALKFEINLEENLYSLLRELKIGAYRPGRSICFIVTNPVPREIFAADFRDRIVHHLFVGELIEKAERMFIFDSYACRPKKGTHRAVSRAFDFSKMISRNFKESAWYMKIDISSFFMSIDKNRLYAETLALIDKHKKSDSWKMDMSDLAGLIIFHRPQDDYIRKGDPVLARLVPEHKSLLGCQADKGLPIGNYSSQFLANLYMNRIDHYIKRNLQCRYYTRYVDDLILFDCAVSRLKYFLIKIDKFLKQNLALSLNQKKTVIQPVERGIDMLGYFLKENKVWPRRSVTRRYKNRLYPDAIGVKETPREKLKAIAASYKGHAEHFC